MGSFSTQSSRAEIGTRKPQVRRRVRWMGPVIGVEGGILGPAPVKTGVGVVQNTLDTPLAARYLTRMHRFTRLTHPLIALLLLAAGSPASAADTFRVATYNLENYVLTAVGSRPAKTEESRARIRKNILALKPDVLALQEVGGQAALRELQDSLAADGLSFPHAELVPGFDTNIQVAILSRFPIVARRFHSKESYLLQGRRFRVSRGFGEVDIQVNDRYIFTLLTAHLKSKRASDAADEGDMRLEEAKLLREKIDARLAANPRANLLVAGDLNDSKNSPALREIMGARGRPRLVDTRPAERTPGAAPAAPPADRRSVTWTHFYAAEDLYSRIDYLLLSSGMAREWVETNTFVLATPEWGDASDHRPLVATFRATDR